MKQDIAALAGIALLVGGVGWYSLGAAAALLGLILIMWAYVTSKVKKDGPRS